jgi:hypothetical protein
VRFVGVAGLFVVLIACAPVGVGQAVGPVDASHLPKALVAAQQVLLKRDFTQAKVMFTVYLSEHPGNIDAEVGVADAELGLHEYEAAELGYRRVVAAQPERWLAHKNLVIVEAELGRWEEFDRERALLRGARERGAPGISARESDVIDAFDIGGEHWIVREYYEPVGRSLTRYNFERFGADGKVKAYVSLESAEAAKAIVPEGAVVIGKETVPETGRSMLALNWYTSKGHGEIARYDKGEPTYEVVRAAVIRWLRSEAGATATNPVR